MNILSSSIQALLLLAAVWYSWETRQLRVQSENQLKILRRQSRVSTRPFLLVATIDRDEAGVRRAIEMNKDFDAKKRQELLQHFDKAPRFAFVASIVNSSEMITLDINAWVYDQNKKSFLKSAYGIEVLSHNDHEIVPFFEQYISRDTFKLQLRESTEAIAEKILSSLPESEFNYLIVTCSDTDDGEYCFIRPFTIKSGELSHRKSIFIAKD